MSGLNRTQVASYLRPPPERRKPHRDPVPAKVPLARIAYLDTRDRGAPTLLCGYARAEVRAALRAEAEEDARAARVFEADFVMTGVT